MPKCPNCGSTAQVRKMSSTENMAYTEIYDQWKCGCGAIFQVTFKRAKIKTVTKICAEYEKENKEKRN